MRFRTLWLLLASILTPAVLLAQTQPEVFDVNVYEGIYVDLQNAYGINTNGAQNHWLNQGLPVEGRRASIIFDPVYYIAHNPGVPTGFVNALQDFMNNGLAAGKRGSLEFDVKFYLARYSDLAAAFGTNYLAAADHFLNQGLPCEGRQGSADFNVQDYIGMYPEVSVGFPKVLSCTSGPTDFKGATLHWLRRGKAFGRHGFGFFPVNTECSSGQTVEFDTVPGSGAFTVTVGQSSQFTSDTSVFYMNPPQGFAAQLTRVASNPAQGQYSVSSGVYTFNSADKEQPVKITYKLNPVPANYQRIFFADPATFQGTFGDGSSASSPLRPDSVVFPSGPKTFNLDYQLRCRIEGGMDCTQDGIPFLPTNLIVCFAPGNYLTDGEYDWIFNGGHTANSNLGFTLGSGWHIHGSGLNQTFFKLNQYVPITNNPHDQGLPTGTGWGAVFGTHTDASSDNIEISDLFIDDNYPALHNINTSVPLNLAAIVLRSDGSGHNIHNIDVVNTAGEIAVQNIKFEGFPVIITSASGNITPSQSQNNQIKYVLMSGFSPTGACTGITAAHVVAEVAFNAVTSCKSTFSTWGG